jgi:hypothetical protein
VNWQQDRDMEPTRFLWAINILGMSQAAVARYLDLSEKQIYRMAHGLTPVPVPVALLLNALIHIGIKPAVPRRRKCQPAAPAKRGEPLDDPQKPVSVP